MIIIIRDNIISFLAKSLIVSKNTVKKILSRKYVKRKFLKENYTKITFINWSKVYI